MKKFVSLFAIAGFLLVGISCEKDPASNEQDKPDVPVEEQQKPEELSAELSVSGLTPMGCAKKGTEITFALDNLKGGPVSYSWTFPGGTPEASTEASPKVVWNDQINDVEVSVVITSEADGSTLTLKQNIIAGNYPCMRTYPDLDYDPWSFEGTAWGGWIAFTTAGLDMANDAESPLMWVEEGGANGTAHCLRINTPSMWQTDKYPDGTVMLFPRYNWFLTPKAKNGEKYILEFWTKREFNLDDAGISNAEHGYAFSAVQVVNECNMYDTACDFISSVHWQYFFPESEYENQDLTTLYASWVQGLTISAPADGWVKTSVEFEVAGELENYNNVFPWFYIEYWRNQGGSVWLDEIQMYLVEE